MKFWETLPPTFLCRRPIPPVITVAFTFEIDALDQGVGVKKGDGLSAASWAITGRVGFRL
jgi:hypothetical protein